MTSQPFRAFARFLFSGTRRQTRQRFLLAVFALWLAQPALADVSAPQEQPKAKLTIGVAESSGGYSRSVVIEVPRFHDLQPKLALGYTSSGENGFVGVGWTLGGLSFIERASPGGGAPRYDASDVYLLDGAPLVANCTTFGGTHCPRHQTYQRISFDATANKWTVIDKDGTKSVYTALYTVTSGTFRWALKTETDTNGNAVTYNYSCESGGNCYPDTITYNGATITFYRQSRATTDKVSFANGNTIGVTNDRLRAIGVKVGTNHARAYALTYTESADTKRSLLQSVKQYGTDVVIDANGVITAGTSLPATSFIYTAASGDKLTAVGGANPSVTLPMRTSCISGDYNQDGNSSDLACYSGSGTWAMAFGSPDGWVTGNSRSNLVSDADVTKKCIGGDFNRDGMSDIACYTGANGVWRVALTSGYNQPPGTSWTVQNWTGPDTGAWVETCVDYGDGGLTCTDNWIVFPVSERCLPGDYNGDGRTDLACYTGTYSGSWKVSLSGDSNSWNTTTWAGPSVSRTIPVTERCLTGDFNGDGKTDISCQTGTSTGQWSTYLANAAGTDFSNAGNWTAGAVALPVRNYCLTGDFNADGKTDLTCYSGANGSWNTALSTGKSFSVSSWTGGAAPTIPVSDKCAVGDTNADGRSDITCLLSTSGSWTTSHSLGNGWQALSNWTGSNVPGALPDRCISGDFNGDGLADFTCRTSSSTWQVLYPDGAAFQPDLLRTVNNGIGGKATVAYAPSSRWANFNTAANQWANAHEMPVGTVVPTVKEVKHEDGQGFVESFTYKYERAKWSYGLKQFVGFQRADMHLSDGACHVSLFMQTDASPGALSEYHVAASTTTPLPRYRINRTYIETQSAPYVSLVDEEVEHEQENKSTGYRIGKKRYFYDTYGNVEKLYDHGDIDVAVSDDDRTTHSVHYPNTTDYVVDKPGFLRVYAGIGIGDSDKLKVETLYHYDDNTYYYDAPTKGKLTKSSEWDDQRGSPSANTSVAYSNSSYGYDSYGNVTSTTDPAGRVTTITFNDPANTTYNNVYPIQICNALNQCGTTKWDLALGLQLEVTDVNNALTKIGYDKVGRKISETDPANNTTTWGYYDFGDPTQQRIQILRPDDSGADVYGIVGVRWTNTYIDGFGRTRAVHKEGPTVTYWDYSIEEEVTHTAVYAQNTYYKGASSNIRKQSNWHFYGETPRYTEFEYDESDRVTKVTHPGGGAVTYTYDYDGSFKPYVKTVGEMGQETKTWQDTDGHVIKVQEKDGASTYTTVFEYDWLGHKVKTTDALGNETRMTYDSLGRKLTETRAGGAKWTYTYYKDGQVNTEKDAKNQTTTYTYDGVGRLKTKVAGGQTTTWYYDEANYGASIGRLTRVVSPNSSKEYTYDNQGRYTAVRTGIDNAVFRLMQMSYDSRGRLKTLTYPDGEIVTYTYDGGANLYSVSGYVTAMYWNAAGQLARMDYVNGTYNNYTYDDNRGFLKTANAKIYTSLNGWTTLYTASYDYDLSGRVTLMTQGTPTAVTTKYTYDPLDRLLTIKDANNVLIQSYSYNAIGNITNNSQIGNYTYGNAGHKHAVTTAGSGSYDYDANGSMLVSPGTAFTWDAQNRLGSVTRSGVTTNFAYDEAEQRVKKTTGSVVSYYFSPLLERWGSTDIQYYYAGPILVAQKDGATKNWYHADRLGSTRAMTNASGNEVKEYDYKAYGADTASGTARNERGYTGHITDGETGLVYMGGRYYAATLSRFISADSIIPDEGNPQALNRYSYVYNNPINNTDPNGHTPNQRPVADPEGPDIEYPPEVLESGVGAMFKVFQQACKRHCGKVAQWFKKVTSKEHVGKLEKGTINPKTGKVVSGISNRGFIYITGGVNGGLSALKTAMETGDPVQALLSGLGGVVTGGLAAFAPVSVAAMGKSVLAVIPVNVFSAGIANATNLVFRKTMRGEKVTRKELINAGLYGAFIASGGVLVASIIKGTPAILLGFTHAEAAGLQVGKAGLTVVASLPPTKKRKRKSGTPPSQQSNQGLMCIRSPLC